MKIWIVKHHQDNGEHYEDRYTWDEFYYFSSYEKALAYYCDHIIDDYLGSFSIVEKTLDTQEETELEYSPWGGYTSMYDDVDNECYSEDYEDDHYCDDSEDGWPSLSIDELAEQQSIQEELMAEKEWLTHEGENYQIFKEIEECELAKLNKALDELITL